MIALTFFDVQCNILFSWKCKEKNQPTESLKKKLEWMSYRRIMQQKLAKTIENAKL